MNIKKYIYCTFSRHSWIVAGYIDPDAVMVCSRCGEGKVVRSEVGFSFPVPADSMYFIYIIQQFVFSENQDRAVLARLSGVPDDILYNLGES